MKSIHLYFIVYFFVLTFTFSCKTGDENPILEEELDTTQIAINQNIKSITLQVDKLKIIANGAMPSKIKVISDKGTDVTANCKLYSNNALLISSSFAPSTPNTFKIKAVYDTIVSNVVEISAYKNNVFNKKNNIIIEDYTATWCGYCPNVTYKINDAKQLDNRIIPIAIHLGDAYEISAGKSLAATYEVNGIPKVIVVRGEIWDQNFSFFTSYLTPNATSAISIESSINGANVEIKSKITVSDPISKQYAVGTYITEDSILASQANYKNDGKGNPILNFVNNHTLRHAGSNIFGTPIPESSFSLDGEFEQSITIPISTKWVKKNCSIIVFIADKNSNKIINAQHVKLGENTP